MSGPLNWLAIDVVDAPLPSQQGTRMEAMRPPWHAIRFSPFASDDTLLH